MSDFSMERVKEKRRKVFGLGEKAGSRPKREESARRMRMRDAPKRHGGERRAEGGERIERRTKKNVGKARLRHVPWLRFSFRFHT